jgi:uncharacterized repeat protein (TIGR01451 family)
MIEDGKQTITETGYNGHENPEPVVKVELHKKKLDSVVVKFGYGITITNEGDIAGYATEITDYIPEGLKFDEKANTGWYLSEGNKVSNLSLSNTKIEAGKTKKLKLALTANITDDTLGSYINKTKIIQTTNDKNIPEINFDNNTSEVELLITIKTGKVILCLSLISVTVGINIIIMFLMKQKKINFKKLYK